MPYGSWPSPIGPADVARGEVRPEWVGFVGDEVWWTQMAPQYEGRTVLMRRGQGQVRPALPGQWDVRSRVIEYGARPWAALGASVDDGIVFVHRADQRVYLFRPGGAPTPLTPAGSWPAELRYGDFEVPNFAARGGEVWCLRETVSDTHGTRVHRTIVAVPLDGSAVADPYRIRPLVADHHFLTGPRVSPDGRRVAWLGWDHPAMPWDTTDLMVADIRPDGTIGRPTRVAGGPGVSVIQVEWAPDEADTLYALMDPAGWWNIYRVSLDGTAVNRCPVAEEFGDALWRIGQRWFLPLAGGRLVVTHGTSTRRLGLLAPDGALTDMPSPYTEWWSLATDGRRIAAVAASPHHQRTVVHCDRPGGEVTVVQSPNRVPDRFVSTPFTRTYQGADGRPVHAYVYPPHHPDVAAGQDELPPYVVAVHGGPTDRSPLVESLDITFFTSRGIGIIDVQYGGSTGFGRAYREVLREEWGVVDVADCATAVRGLVAEGLADPARICIRGASAGGWTAMASLVTKPDLYRGGCAYYPLLDPASWRGPGTHDFESDYLDWLIGAWPEHQDRYAARSWASHAGRIRAPFVVFQGMDDLVCRPAQAQALVARLAGGAVDARLLTFAGEGHGFRRPETIVACLDAELDLYAAVCGGDR